MLGQNVVVLNSCAAVCMNQYGASQSIHTTDPTTLKGELASFFIALFDAPKYDNIWTENENSIYRPPSIEVLMLKECSKRVQYVF